MIISLIVAAADNNAIGRNNQLLWRLPNDLKIFKNTTWAMPIIMGRKTFESVKKPLPGRINIIVSRQTDLKSDGIILAPSVGNALYKAADTNCKEAFIIGGGEIYKQSIDIADKIYITRIHTVVADADTFFPKIDTLKWQLISDQNFNADDKHAFNYSFQVWKKK